MLPSILENFYNGGRTKQRGNQIGKREVRDKSSLFPETFATTLPYQVVRFLTISVNFKYNKIVFYVKNLQKTSKSWYLSNSKLFLQRGKWKNVEKSMDMTPKDTILDVFVPKNRSGKSHLLRFLSYLVISVYQCAATRRDQ